MVVARSVAPVELLGTDRLSLRQLRPADAEVISAYRSVPEVAEHQSWEAPYPLESAAALVREMQARTLGAPGWIQIGIELRATGELVGDVAFEHRTEFEAAVGYTLAPAHWGHGYASEAVGALVAHGLDVLGHDVVVAEVAPANIRSVALVTRLGFTRVGPLPGGDEDRWVRNRAPGAPRRSP
jgi:aminoglycoside 6'-N-acetyltransferase